MGTITIRVKIAVMAAVDTKTKKVCLPRPPPKVYLQTINPHITCGICDGYLIDATTVDECLHSCECTSFAALRFHRHFLKLVFVLLQFVAVALFSTYEPERIVQWKTVAPPSTKSNQI